MDKCFKINSILVASLSVFVLCSAIQIKIDSSIIIVLIHLSDKQQVLQKCLKFGKKEKKAINGVDIVYSTEEEDT